MSRTPATLTYVSLVYSGCSLRFFLTFVHCHYVPIHITLLDGFLIVLGFVFLTYPFIPRPVVAVVRGITPFQVVHSVVHTVFVLMIHLGHVIRVLNESQSNKPMQTTPSCFVFLRKSNL